MNKSTLQYDTTAAKQAFFASRERQANELDLPTLEQKPIVLRYEPTDGRFSIRHPARGEFSIELREAHFNLHRGSWRTEFADVVTRLAAAVVHSIGHLPATFEAAREFSRRPLEDLSIFSHYPTLRVVSTEIVEDTKDDATTMMHLVGANDEMIEGAYAAMRFLAADDPDHAAWINNVGFGRNHVIIGHRLANVPPGLRTNRDDAFALKLARLYRRQLPAELASVIGAARAR